MELTRIAGALRRQGATQNEILAALRAVNIRCRPPHGEKDLIRIARSVARYEPEQRKYNLTDGGNGEFYADEYGDRVRYDRRRGAWLVWDGTIWGTNNDGALTRLALKAARKRGMAAYVEKD